MRNTRKSIVILMGTVSGAAAADGTGTGAPDQPAGQLVQEVAAAGTPHVLNGEVYSVVQVGTTMVLGGTFTSARNDNSQTSLPRNRLLAFNANTGQISTTFLPNPNGTVRVVIPAGDGETVYVGGSFTSIGGVARDSLARVRISDGAVVTDVQRREHHRHGARPAAERRPALARRGLHPRRRPGPGRHHDGEPDDGRHPDLHGPADRGQPRRRRHAAVSRSTSRPTATAWSRSATSTRVGGVQRHQFLMLDISGATAQVANFRTTFFHSACSASFDTYMRDVDFSPDGSFFVVTTTGAYGGSRDRLRHRIAGSRPTRPATTSSRRGSTTPAATRRTPWRSPTRRSTSAATSGGGTTRSAATRPGRARSPARGIAALDPVNGLPLSWDPTRTKGVGVFDFLNTPQGLWVASDTDRIGNFQLKSRIARMLPGGTSFPAVKTTVLPNDVYTASTAGALSRRRYDATVGAPQSPPNGGINWGNVRGAFMINGSALPGATATARSTGATFNGTTYGAPIAVDTADEIVPLTDWRADIQNATGMFFDRGRIYFTRTGSNQLFYRYFSPESDVVGAKRFVASNNVSGIDFSQVRGMFVTDTHLYWAQPDGNLRRISWQQTPQAGVPVAGTAVHRLRAGDGRRELVGRPRPLAVPERQRWRSGDGEPAPGGELHVLLQPAHLQLQRQLVDRTTRGSPPTPGTSETAGPTPAPRCSTPTAPRVLAMSRSPSPTARDSPTPRPSRSTPRSPGCSSSARTAATRTRRRTGWRCRRAPRPGDALVLFLTSNTTGTTVANPCGLDDPGEPGRQRQGPGVDPYGDRRRRRQP